jgi:hypothetical protein
MHIYFYYDLQSMAGFVTSIIVIAVDVGAFGDMHVHIIASGTFGMIQGTFAMIRGTFGMIQGIFGMIQESFGMNQGNSWHDRRVIVIAVDVGAPLQTRTCIS